MTIRMISAAEWDKAMQLDPQNPLYLNGYSPGGVAARLGMSRAGIHYAIRRGDLDATYVTATGGKEKIVGKLDEPVKGLRAIIITEESVNRFKRLRSVRRTG